MSGVDPFFDHINAGVIRVTRDVVVLQWNRFMVTATGRRAEDVVGQSLLECFPEIPERWLRWKLGTVFELGIHAFSSWRQRPYLIRAPHNRPLTGGIDAMRQDVVLLPTTIGGDEIESVYIVITDVTDAAVAHLALEAAHTELEREMEERKRLQADLLLSQKLSAVGQLAAGVAHEMNTPLQYLYDNVSFLSDVLQDVTAVLTRYRAAIAETEVSPAIVESLRALEEDMDLDFLLDRYPKTLQSSTKGLDRLARLVTSMKAFRAADQANIVDADLNGAIDATMTVIRGQLPSTTEVKIDLDDIPTVECQLGEINEAIFNLILNASDAIDDAQREHGLIEVTTTHIDDQVEISISDNGCGIPPHVQDRIFDPFFTTKSVGHGTGQGLHVSRSVAERHGGSLRFETEVDRGTTFHLRLPLQQDTSSKSD